MFVSPHGLVSAAVRVTTQSAAVYAAPPSVVRTYRPLAARPFATQTAPAEGEEEAAEPVVVEAPAKNGAVVMAEALYQATYEEVLRLVPKHLAQNRPVVLCGGINVITGPGKPDFFACKNFQVYSPREPDQPNDAFSSYRASLRALLFDPSAP